MNHLLSAARIRRLTARNVSVSVSMAVPGPGQRDVDDLADAGRLPDPGSARGRTPWNREFTARAHWIRGFMAFQLTRRPMGGVTDEPFGRWRA